MDSEWRLLLDSDFPSKRTASTMVLKKILLTLQIRGEVGGFAPHSPKKYALQKQSIGVLSVSGLGIKPLSIFTIN